MANSKHTYFAEIDPDGTVLRVIVSDAAFVAKLGGTWVQTWMPDNIARPRKNYAGIGHKWDVERDAFIAPQPDADHVLDETDCRWKLPPAKQAERDAAFAAMLAARKDE